ncbi:hypothetical protein CDD81_137 [Ophiocordyceps australis]|uniref:FAD-binding FR-type domain-containing protein n=1 Tax=Ophiocordyceps australis TaxID=1399860 RepID=A0A2C5XCJ4_9HYPO|nr:hypothetical protein CDD81_137 [Ophiocordyceps australis]
MLIKTLLFVAHVSWAAAQNSFCSRACTSALASVRFNDSSAIDAPWDEQPCRSRLALTSFSLCLQVNCASESRKTALDDIDSMCRQRLGSPRPSVGANFTQHDVAQVQRLNKNDSLGLNRPLGQVALPSTQLFTACHGIIIFWVAVVAIGLLNKLLLMLCMMRRGAFARAPRLSKGKRWLQRRLLMPATFGYACAHKVWWATIPPRCQSITLAIFVIVNFAFCLSGYRFIADNMYFPTLRKQVLRYVADRTGILSYANFPLIWVFGMRNNMAIWLTGWNHTTYNDFHRWVARIAVLEAVLHSVGYTALILQGGWSYYLWYFTMFFWNVGILATLVMCALLAFSMVWMRRNHYETFLLLHIGLSVVLLLAMLGHVSILQGQYTCIFWACVYIWALDRLLRLLRIIAFNPLGWAADAWAVYDSSANIIRLSVPLKAAYRVPPGSYFYLMVLDASRCWESHPFTVACVADSDRPRGPGEQAPLLEYQGADAPDCRVLQFLVRPCNGFTRRLRDMAANGSKLPLLVEGPYGHSRPLHGYHDVVFILGGSGVVAALSYMASLSNNKAGPRSICLHWAVREAAFAEQVVLNHLAFHCPMRLSVDIYLPQLSPLHNLAALGVCLHTSRLEIASILTTATAAAGPFNSLAIVACGPASMVDDARSAVVQALAHAQCQMDYFEESW